MYYVVRDYVVRVVHVWKETFILVTGVFFYYIPLQVGYRVPVVPVL